MRSRTIFGKKKVEKKSSQSSRFTSHLRYKLFFFTHLNFRAKNFENAIFCLVAIIQLSKNMQFWRQNSKFKIAPKFKFWKKNQIFQIFEFSRQKLAASKLKNIVLARKFNFEKKNLPSYLFEFSRLKFTFITHAILTILAPKFKYWIFLNFHFSLLNETWILAVLLLAILYASCRLSIIEWGLLRSPPSHPLRL